MCYMLITINIMRTNFFANCKTTSLICYYAQAHITIVFSRLVLVADKVKTHLKIES